MKPIVVIPVYKPQPSDEETRSLRQCIRVLGRHDLCLVCPPSLCRDAYDRLFAEQGVACRTECFGEEFFQSQRAYNRLMLSEAFYRRFAAWDYMLIYQTDAFVFSDELEEWCHKGYDYIGAPWCTLKGEIDWHNSGNGGFSLRKIGTFIELFRHKGKVLTAKGLWKFHRYRGPLHRLPLVVQGMFGRYNRLEDYITGDRVNEDLFYATLSHRTYRPFRIPSTREAMYFAFEERPSFLYSLTGRLPFGCHAYLKNEYDTFYQPLSHDIEEQRREADNQSGTAQPHRHSVNKNTNVEPQKETR